MKLSSESLTNGIEGGAASILVIEDSQPFGEVRLLFISERDLVQLPFIVLDDVV